MHYPQLLNLPLLRLSGVLLTVTVAHILAGFLAPHTPYANLLLLPALFSALIAPFMVLGGLFRNRHDLSVCAISLAVCALLMLSAFILGFSVGYERVSGESLSPYPFPEVLGICFIAMLLLSRLHLFFCKQREKAQQAPA